MKWQMASSAPRQSLLQRQGPTPEAERLTAIGQESNSLFLQLPVDPCAA